MLDGELMPDGTYIVFDVLAMDGMDLRKYPLSARKAILSNLHFPEFVSTIKSFNSFRDLESNGFTEGVVVKDLHSKYGRGWWKAKRVETDDVMVVSVNHENNTAEVSCGGRVSGVPSNISTGDIIEVEFSKRFESGKLRNGRYLRLRDDKSATNVHSRFERVSASC